MSRSKVVAYLASLAGAVITTWVAWVLFEPPRWGAFLIFVVAIGVNRIRDDLDGKS